MLMRADVLLLDEPTNHLDTTNVAWLESYLNSMPVRCLGRCWVPVVAAANGPAVCLQRRHAGSLLRA
jgi:hypothetical protein